MALAHYNGYVENRADGKALGGVVIKVYTYPGNVLQNVFADLSSTPKPLVESDENGAFDFYIADGNYDIEYNYAGNIVERLVNVPISNPANYGSAGSFYTIAETNANTMAANIGTATGDTLEAWLTRYRGDNVYLDDYLNAAQRTDIANFTGAVDCSAALQSAVTAAAGRPVILPQGRIRLNSQVAYVTSSTDPRTPGMKLIGQGSSRTILSSHVANDAAIKIDTTASFKFQDGIDFRGLKLTGEYGDPANGTGLYMRRAYNVLLEDVEIDFFRRDGVIVQTVINDADSSNQIRLSGCYIHRCFRWGFNHDAASGQNDLSFVTMRDSRFNQCGTDARKTVTGISQAAAAVVTCTGHGFVNGDIVRFGGVKGMTQINQRVGTVTVINANSFSVNINTTGFSAYTGDGAVFLRKPPSGSVRINSQMASLQDTWITESKNVGIFIDGDAAPAFSCKVENFTIENTTGYSFICTGATGLYLNGNDMRTNQQVATNYGHILFDGTNQVISGVHCMENTFIHFEGSPSLIANSPHTVIDGIGGGLGHIYIEADHFKQIDPTNRIRYGSGLWAATGLRLLSDTGAMIHVNVVSNKQTFSASGSYTADVTNFKRHVLTCGAGMSGQTLTLNNPAFGLLAGPSTDGQKLKFVINNTSGGVVNLAYNFGIFGASAPTTVANNNAVTLDLEFESTLGWVNK